MNIAGDERATAIETLLKAWSEAVRSKDVSRIMEFYHPDVVAFDAISQLQFKGLDAYRQHWAACLEMCPGAMLFEQHQLQIHAEQTVAFAHWLNHCGVEGDKDASHSCWMRGSAGYRLTGTGWKIVHEHFSAPFDMTGGTALMNLQP
ncbi:nuclear transport factor 2 family protein [Pseudomonas syringae]|nr:nuclear transport factor 2 family protein [Pseudomonas syringae]MBD8789269.1 nuclear transport factor 2 family protein [Pseudomonas syringae]MBD8800287.1 nuclear transport factor 2 family protein [Pseudomonas syringae]MBD8810697.1 nuclear transport factor 2 family protein [Pseudomonas syringae]